MCRPGMSRVDLLVILVVCVLVVGGLLVPAVQKVREADARTRSNNNLKEAAFAVHNFHDTYRRFPDGYAMGALYATRPVSMWVQLLPYLNEDRIYKEGNFDVPVAVFQLPSDPTARLHPATVGMAANIRVFGFQSLTGSVANNVGHAIDPPDGGIVSGLTMGRLTSMDGTSNILMLSTRFATCDGRPTWYAADAHGGTSQTTLMPPGYGAFTGAGAYSAAATRERSLTAVFQILPRSEDCVAEKAIYGHAFGTGGMSVALADGSVKNVAPTITPSTFSRAMSPGDGARFDAGFGCDDDERISDD